MSLRICLVTPFSWSKPHEANDHVDGLAAALRRRGHHVTVLAPSGRAGDLLAGRRALARGRLDDGVLAVAPAVRVTRRSRLGLPVGVRANLALALREGTFDVVHGVEPALPSLSYLALSDAHTLTVATFLSPERVFGPARRGRRERLLARVDALLATSDGAAAAAARRFPGDYRVITPGVDTSRIVPGEKRPLVAIEADAAGRPLVRAVLRELRDLPGWEALVLHTRPLAARPPIPRAVRERVHVRSAVKSETRAVLLAEAGIVVPAPGGSERFRLEALAAGCALAEPNGVNRQPELAAAAVARLVEDEALREREAAKARREAEAQSFDLLAEELDGVYRRLTGRRRTRYETDPLAGREWIVTDLHMHTTWSADCSIPVADLLEHAQSEGLGAIAVTDHNAFGGALEAAALAEDRDLIVIPGEEVKTDGQGEVIGLFLEEEIPRGMSFVDTIAAIREQEGLVYLPHPFDRMHAIPDPATLHRHLADIDVLEVYNARLLFEAYNDEALRFARKYGLLAGAGSDAHVLQGVGTGALRMRRFEGPEEFLLSLRSAEVLRRPKSLAYLQSLKWVAQVKEKVR
jgi:predicted metal-dependent phosphoesterase TrpH/glycosyltransferase involved in cell wall biosynthesis